MSRLWIIINPAAGRKTTKSQLSPVCHYLQNEGWQVEVAETRAPGDATLLARKAVIEGCEVVVSGGGDGTTNEIIQALAYTPTTLGVIPLGTANVWATEVGIPSGSVKAARVISCGKKHRIDLGIAGGRYFLLMAGIGFDGAVIRRVDTVTKRLLGKGAFILQGLFLAPVFRGETMALAFDGQRLESPLLLAVLGNTRLFGVYARITARARADDGWLDLCILKGSGFQDLARHFVRVLLNRHLNDPLVSYYQVKSLQVTGLKSLPVQVDGEVIGTTPMDFSVAPGALEVLLPIEAWTSGLFARGD